MAPKEFPIFPALPPEIRRKIYLLATAPRLLPIYSTTTRSRAPTPALLHTCRESRLTLISSGYRLAFSRPKTSPEEQDEREAQWFNPALDTVFAIAPPPVFEYVHPTPSYRMVPNPWPEKRFTAQDAKSVRYLATMGSCSYPEAGTSQRVLQMLRFFGGIESLEVVECVEFEQLEGFEFPEDGWMGSVEAFLARFEGWPLQTVDVGREEMAGWPDLLVSRAVDMRFGLRFREWVEGGGDEGEYLGSLYRCFEDGLRRERQKEKGQWKVPEVRSVHVVSEWGKRRIERYRERYWEVRHERLRMDRTGREKDRPASPFSEMFEDELEVLESMYARKGCGFCPWL